MVGAVHLSPRGGEFKPHSYRLPLLVHEQRPLTLHGSPGPTQWQPTSPERDRLNAESEFSFICDFGTIGVKVYACKIKKILLMFNLYWMSVWEENLFFY